jgi:hypothetical protein
MIVGHATLPYAMAAMLKVSASSMLQLQKPELQKSIQDLVHRKGQTNPIIINARIIDG